MANIMAGFQLPVLFEVFDQVSCLLNPASAPWLLVRLSPWATPRHPTRVYTLSDIIFTCSTALPLRVW
jgi:hypothetical protein